MASDPLSWPRDSVQSRGTSPQATSQHLRVIFERRRGRMIYVSMPITRRMSGTLVLRRLSLAYFGRQSSTRLLPAIHRMITCQRAVLATATGSSVSDQLKTDGLLLS